MAKIYALLDEETLQSKGWSINQFINRAKSKGAKILQYRNKNGSLKEIEGRLKEIVSLFDGVVIVNDYLQLAYLCDGLHIGQEDLKNFGDTPYEAVLNIREKLGTFKWLGLSTHNEDEIKIANELPLNYIGLGAYRDTKTKSDAKILGDKLPKLAKLSRHLVAAIGGVRLDDKIANVEYLVVGSGMYED